MSLDHAPAAPSSASQWVYCSGVLRMRQLYPARPDSPHAMEGTAAHWVLSEILASRPAPVGSLAPNGIAITQEMVDGAELFIENIPVEVLSAGGSIHVEGKVGPGAIHPDCWGTPDVWWVRDSVLHVADYKYGHGYVDAWRNWQLICYVAEVLHLHPQWGDIAVELHICQPRCYSSNGTWRTWRTTAVELQPFIEQLRKAARVALSEHTTCVAGDWCQNCSAIVYCPSAQHAVSYALRTAYIADASHMPLAAMGLLRILIEDAQSILKDMAKGLDEELEAAIRGGTPVDAWTLARGRGKTEWTVPVEEVSALGDMLGIPLRKDAVITPTQAVAKGMDESILATYAKLVPGALKLTRSETNDMSRVFGRGE